jgi:hypothetical protein
MKAAVIDSLERGPRFADSLTRWSAMGRFWLR